LAVMRPGATDQGAVDIEEDQSGGGIHGCDGAPFMIAETGRAAQGGGAEGAIAPPRVWPGV
jgi:hypothetical protein